MPDQWQAVGLAIVSLSSACHVSDALKEKETPNENFGFTCSEVSSYKLGHNREDEVVRPLLSEDDDAFGIHRDSTGQANLLSPIVTSSPRKECPDHSRSRGKSEGMFGAQPTRHSCDQTIKKKLDFMEPLLNSISEETGLREKHPNFTDSLSETDGELESQENHQLSNLLF